MTNKTNAVLYIGVTSDLQKRVSQHKNHVYEGFTDKYNCTKLVYFEECNDINVAIAREKQLKNWHREWKNNLVNQINPEWKDLSEWDAETSSAWQKTFIPNERVSFRTCFGIYKTEGYWNEFSMTQCNRKIVRFSKIRVAIYKE